MSEILMTACSAPGVRGRMPGRMGGETVVRLMGGFAREPGKKQTYIKARTNGFFLMLLSLL